MDQISIHSENYLRLVEQHLKTSSQHLLGIVRVLRLESLTNSKILLTLGSVHIGELILLPLILQNSETVLVENSIHMLSLDYLLVLDHSSILETNLKVRHMIIMNHQSLNSPQVETMVLLHQHRLLILIMVLSLA